MTTRAFPVRISKVTRTENGARRAESARIHSGAVRSKQPASAFGPKWRGNGCGGGLIEGRRMGRYIDEILQPGEKVLYSTNAHWIFFLPAIVGLDSWRAYFWCCRA